MRVKLFLILCSVSFFAQAQNYETKKVYVYSFVRLIQWPEESRVGDFEIAVLGETPFFDQLIEMASKKKLGDRTIKVIKLATIAELNKSHILVLPSAQSASLAEVLKKISTGSTLVVTEQDGLALKGSHINFVLKDGKLAFELNQNALTKNKLKSANELTRLAILL
jgi:hypothetical protein